MEVVGSPSIITTAWLRLGRKLCSKAARKSWGTFSARSGEGPARRRKTAAAGTFMGAPSREGDWGRRILAASHSTPHVLDWRPRSMQACLVLPTFNEAPNLEALLAAVRKAVPALGILVVDDRS